MEKQSETFTLTLSKALGSTKYLEMLRNSLDNIILKQYTGEKLLTIDGLLALPTLDDAYRYAIDKIEEAEEKYLNSDNDDTAISTAFEGIFDNWEKVKVDHLNHIKFKYGINAIVTDEKFIEEDETYNTVDNIINDKASHETDNVNNLDTTTKILLSSITKQVQSGTESTPYINELFMPENHNFSDVYNYMIGLLADTPQDLLFDKLQEDDNYFSEAIYDTLTGEGNVYTKNPPQRQYAINNFIRDFHKSKINHQKILLRSGEGKGIITNFSNANSLNDNHTLDTFVTNSLITYDSVMGKDSEVEVFFEATGNQFLENNLAKLGIDKDFFRKLNVTEQFKFQRELSLVVKDFIELQEKNGNKPIPLLETLKSLQTKNKLRYIIDTYQKYNPDTVSNQFLGIGGKSLWGISQTSYASEIISDFNNSNSKEEFLEKNPQLNNYFTDGSLLLDKVGEIQINLDTLNGLGIDDNNQNEAETKDSHYTERIVADMNMFFQSNTLLTPTHSSKSTNYVIKLKEPYVYSSDEFEDLLGTYYDAEMEVINAVDEKTNPEVAEFVSRFKKVSNNGKEFRLFYGFSGTKEKVIKDYMESINQEMDAYIANLKEYGILQPMDKDGNPTTVANSAFYVGINRATSHKKDSNPITADFLVKRYFLNRLVNNYEMAKMFYGDPANYGKDEIFKRIYGAFSTKDFIRNDTNWDDFIEANPDHNDRYSEEAQAYTGKDAKFLARNYKTLILADAENITANIKRLIDDAQSMIESEDIDIIKTLPVNPEVKAKLIEAYKNNQVVNETDAYAIARFSTYKDMLERTTGWTAIQEEGYKAYMKGEEMPAGAIYSPIKMATYQNELMGKAFEDILMELGTSEEAKSIMDKLSIVTFHKYAISPGIKTFYEGTKTEKLIERMDEEYIDYITVPSASKGETLLNEANMDTFSGRREKEGTAIHQWTSTKGMGIQVNTKSKVSDEVTNITQAMKMLFIDQVDADGNYINKEVADRHEKLNNGYLKMFNSGRKSVMRDMGLALKDGKMIIENREMLRKTLLRNFEGKVPYNILQQFEEGRDLNLDVSPNADKIENVILSMMNKALIKHKWTGENYTQITGHGFVNADEDSEKTGITSSLKFYRTIKDSIGITKVLPAQVAVAVNKDTLLFMEANGIQNVKELNQYVTVALGLQEDGIIDDKNTKQIYRNIMELITMAGGRIPVQHYNSMDVVQVAKFLPINAGKTIIVPPEFTFKAGSDFGYDKLTLYRYKHPLKGKKVGGKKMYQNKTIKIMAEQILAPHNFIRLTTPNNASELKAVAKKSKIYRQPVSSLSKMFSPTANDKAFEEFLTGIKITGVAALAQSHHSLAQLVGLLMNSGKEGMPPINLGRTFSDDGKYISNTNSRMIDASVDVEKDPYIFGLGITINNAGGFFFTIREGKSIEEVSAIFTDPVVQQYEKLKAKYNALYNKVYRNVGDEAIRDEATTYAKKSGYSADNFMKYLDYLEKGLQLKTLMKATNHDTAGIAKNTVENALVQGFTNAVLQDSAPFYAPKTTIDEEGVVTVVKRNAAQEIHDKTFIGIFYTGVVEANILISPLSLLSGKQFNDYLANDIYPKIKNQKGLNLNEAKALTYIRKFKNDVVLYLYQQALVDFMADRKGMPINNLDSVYDSLFSEKGIQKILEAKKNNNTKDLKIIKDLQLYQHKVKGDTGGSRQSYKFYKLINKRYNVPEADLLTESWIELNRENPELARGIARATMLQSGLNNTPIAFTDKIPFEMYSVMAQIVNTFDYQKLKDMLDINDFEKNFTRLNVIKPKYFPAYFVTNYNKDYIAKNYPS